MRNSLRLILACTLIAPLAAFAATPATGTLDVTATVAATCSVNASALSFGSAIDATTPATLPGNGTISVNCTQGNVYGITLGTGQHDVSGKHFVSDGASHTMAYTIYTDAGHGTEWTGSTSVSGTGAGATAVTTNVFGALVVTGTEPAGAYSDAVTITVTY